MPHSSRSLFDPRDRRNWNWFCRLTSHHSWCLPPDHFYIIGEYATELCNRRGCKAERTIKFTLKRTGVA